MKKLFLLTIAINMMAVMELPLVQAQTWQGTPTTVNTTTTGDAQVGGKLLVGANGTITGTSPSIEVRSTLSSNFAKIFTTSNTNSWLSLGNNNNSNVLNIGIGSTNVGGYLWSNTGKVFIGADSDPTLFIDHTNKRVGIGTTTPGLNFEVIGSSNPIMAIGIPNTTPGGYTGIYMAVSTCDGCFSSFSKNKDAVISTVAGSEGDIIIQPQGTGNSIRFGTSTNNVSSQKMRLANNGALLIGTDCVPSDAKLAVNGKIYATEIQVKLPDVAGCFFPDYVFEKDYKLMSLVEVQKYIETNKHLPEIPSADQVEKDGINVTELLIAQMKKIEELTLYLIEQDNKIKQLESKLK